MGSERKSKDKSKKRTSDSPSEEEGESRKKHRSLDEVGEGSKKLDTLKNSHKPSKHHFEHKSEKKHKSKSSKHGRHSESNFTELSSEDYFSKNNEFSTWLKEAKEKFFSDLSADSARELFSEFVEEWNSKKLKSKYYKGIATGPRSSHKWNLKS